MDDSNYDHLRRLANSPEEMDKVKRIASFSDNTAIGTAFPIRTTAARKASRMCSTCSTMLARTLQTRLRQSKFSIKHNHKQTNYETFTSRSAAALAVGFGSGQRKSGDAVVATRRHQLPQPRLYIFFCNQNVSGTTLADDWAIYYNAFSGNSLPLDKQGHIK